MTSRTFKTGLVLQGGGARGAYQVGALKAISEILNSKENPFPIISGTSVGAINASSLAATSRDFKRGARKLETLWQGLNSSKIFDTRPRAVAGSSARWLWTIAFGGLGVGDPCAFLDNAPLAELLSTEFKRRGVTGAMRAGALEAFCITASSYDSGKAITFFETVHDHDGWERARRQGIRAKIKVRHLMASSALPFVFPAKGIDGQYYGDGALRLTAPLSPAVQMGADRLLVVGVRDALPPPIDDTEPSKYPSIGEMGGHALDILFNDSLDADVERVERINRLLGGMTSAARKKSGLRKLDYLVLQPSQDLRSIAGRHEGEMPRTIRLLLSSIGAWRADGRLPSYLLFEPGYINELIELGYRDTLERETEVKRFLTVKQL